MTRHKVRRAVDSWLLRLVYRNLDALIFVSKAAQERFVATWHNRIVPFPPKKMHVVHNSLNIPEIPYNAPGGSRPITGMFHGPIRPGKGLETLIDAMSMLKGKRIRIKIVGSGNPDYLDTIRRRALSRGVMELIDWHKHTINPLDLIAECDFGVLPSIEEEAFGLSNLEYMAMGRPQIASSNGAQSEYISNGKEGILIPPGNPSLLAENISKLASDEDLRLRMGKAAYDSFVDKRSWSHFIGVLKDIYTGHGKAGSKASDTKKGRQQNKIGKSEDAPSVSLSGKNSERKSSNRKGKKSKTKKREINGREKDRRR